MTSLPFPSSKRIIFLPRATDKFMQLCSRGNLKTFISNAVIAQNPVGSPLLELPGEAVLQTRKTNFITL